MNFKTWDFKGVGDKNGQNPHQYIIYMSEDLSPIKTTQDPSPNVNDPHRCCPSHLLWWLHILGRHLAEF